MSVTSDGTWNNRHTLEETLASEPVVFLIQVETTTIVVAVVIIIIIIIIIITTTTGTTYVHGV
jgi:hypothetical protein